MDFIFLCSINSQFIEITYQFSTFTFLFLCAFPQLDYHLQNDLSVFSLNIHMLTFSDTYLIQLDGSQATVLNGY